MKSESLFEIPRRLRRLRSSSGVRALVQETRVGIDDLIAPLFVQEKSGPPEPVESMPGVFRFSPADLVAECRALNDLGIKAVAVFPCIHPSLKDAAGSYALHPDTLILQTIRAIKRATPQLLVITDVALDPYTSHGHDGLLNDAGTRPEPAVSVPSEKLAWPLATETAEPELDPPDTNSGLKLLRHAP